MLTVNVTMRKYYQTNDDDYAFLLESQDLLNGSGQGMS